MRPTTPRGVTLNTLRYTVRSEVIMLEAEQLEQKLREAFVDAERIEIQDLTGTKDHYRAVIVSPAFRGKSRIAQHRMVYAALGDLMHGPIHALALETRAG